MEEEENPPRIPPVNNMGETDNDSQSERSQNRESNDRQMREEQREHGNGGQPPRDPGRENDNWSNQPNPPSSRFPETQRGSGSNGGHGGGPPDDWWPDNNSQDNGEENDQRSWWHGRDGRDGRDGHDGRDGRDGRQPPERGERDDDRRMQRERDRDNFNRELNRQSKLDLNKPTNFSGENRELFRTFQDSCENFFIAKPLIYDTDKAQISFAGSYLTGPALRHYQNLMRQHREGIPIQAFGSWISFIIHFARLFGLHDETLHAQSKLDTCYQKWNEAFGDFLVRFEDIVLLTGYNDAAKRWRLLRQITRSLQDRLADHGEIPATFDGVVTKLLRLDGAKQAFHEMGLGTRNNIKTTEVKTEETKVVTTTVPVTTVPNRQYGYRTKQQGVNGRQAEVGEGETLEAAMEETPREEITTPEGNYPRISMQEWNRRMRSGECGVCGSKEHRYRDHFLQGGPKPVMGRATFIDNHNEEPEQLYIELEGFNEPVHLNDPILEDTFMDEEGMVGNT